MYADFVDENGAIAALQDAGVPILMQAYPDEIGKLDFQHRRDAYCGKFSVTDVFEQYEVPLYGNDAACCAPAFEEIYTKSARLCGICRVVKG